MKDLLKASAIAQALMAVYAPAGKLINFMKPYTAPRKKPSKYTRHQGKQEKARRLRQRERGILQ